MQDKNKCAYGNSSKQKQLNAPPLVWSNASPEKGQKDESSDWFQRL